MTDSLPHALAFAQSLLSHRADAEDIVHDCYERLLTKSGLYDLPRDGTKLLLKSIANASINFVQRRRTCTSLGVQEAAEPTHQSDTDPYRGAIHRELETAIAHALAALPVNQRAVVELRSLGHSLLEVADMLDISHANARVLLHRARTQLADALAPYLEENVT
ncbi:MAG: sigma-70 family RNA polymerase sigma factor [Planctomycetaceae bacterium]|nr:sigma-70 family RNA polymerase sigma factor [Planctomycetaceae bacterium]